MSMSFLKEDKTQIYHQMGCWLLSKVRKKCNP